MNILECDYKVLLFLWRWKVSTSRCIVERLHRHFNMKPDSFYKRLHLLEHSGFVKRESRHVLGNLVSYLALTENGYEQIRESLVELSQDGFKSESPVHDLLSQVIHLGNFIKLNSAPKHLHIFSEQELRRINPSCYPKWIPKLPAHRPDGYWASFYNNSNSIITALELELSLKTTNRYREVVAEYATNSRINHVVWVTSNASIDQAIEKSLQHVEPEGATKHFFVSIPSLLENGWNILLRNKNVAGRNLMSLLLSESDMNHIRKSSESDLNFKIATLLDSRKWSVNSKASKNYKIFKNSDSMGVSHPSHISPSKMNHERTPL